MDRTKQEEEEMHRVFADGPITVLTLTLMFCFVGYMTSGVFEELFKEAWKDEEDEE